MISFRNIFEGELLDLLTSSKQKPSILARVDSHLGICIHFSTPIPGTITIDNDNGDDLNSNSTTSFYSTSNNTNSTSNNTSNISSSSVPTFSLPSTNDDYAPNIDIGYLSILLDEAV